MAGDWRFVRDGGESLCIVNEARAYTGASGFGEVSAGAAQKLLQPLVVWGHVPVRGTGYHPAAAG